MASSPLFKQPILGPRSPNQSVLRTMGAIPAEARGPQRAEGSMQRDFASIVQIKLHTSRRDIEKLCDILHRLAVRVSMRDTAARAVLVGFHPVAYVTYVRSWHSHGHGR